MDNKYNLCLAEKTCDLCGKNFIPTFHWAYKIRPARNRTLYFCSYTCYRKSGGDGGTYNGSRKKK